METENGVWRTVSGRRIFIKEGQSLTDAMKDSGKFETQSDLEFTESGAIKVKDEKQKNKIIDDVYSKFDDETLRKYQNGEANKDNFFVSTRTKFQYIENPDIDLGKPDYTSNSGSKYWYTKEGVYRMSNHWGGGVATCEWDLKGGDFKKEFGQIKTPANTVGFSKWEDFIHIPFQTKDWETDEVYFSTFKSVTGKDKINISNTKKAYKV